jgi:putative tryptophan/tyrosine transport system substrate-binding protein
MLPAATRVAVLVNPINPTNSESMLREMELAARAVGLQLHVLSASSSGEINAAFAIFSKDRPDESAGRNW